MRVVALLLILFTLGCQENFGDLITFNSIKGEVLDEESLEPISGARITTNPITALKFSDENGRFDLDSLSARIYSVRVIAEGYQSKLSSFNLDDIQNSDLLILMEKDSLVSVPPLTPFNPSPANNSLEQLLEVDLSWSSMDDKDSILYNVYFYKPESVEAEQILFNSLDTTVSVFDLQFNTTYFWQVEAVDSDGNSVLGPTWNFKTDIFPDDEFRYAFIRRNNTFEQIYIGNDNREAVQITNEAKDHWRPTFSPQRDQIAFVSIVNGEAQIFTMDRNGENTKQVTSTRPLRTKDVLDSPFAWIEDGQRIAYMDFDKVVSINKDGSGLQEYEIDLQGEIITSLDYSSLGGGRFIITTEIPSSKNAKLFLYDFEQDTAVQILDSLNGQFAHAQFSPSGKQIIYSFNHESEFSTAGIPLNKKLFYFDLSSSEPIDISLGKDGGTADSNPRFVRNGSFVAFSNGPSDGIGSTVTFISDLQDLSQNQEVQRDTLFGNSNMIDWK